ncbi:hypothetical protein phi1422_0007 [Bdellovibrio phage phi1422]|uniref:hypothetical protein n=1 Tax=Bdellovibrio phage phi1422 TaxID=1127515 RepID=UPI0002536D06|nr:hypothetical protein F395_gp07 [Bdellovibrio phage phi1422]AFC22527.1 hypothetical protein phi1422_0007 [Bdellovibrio phage phi1422]
MKPATDRQKKKLESLGIKFDKNITLEEATEILRQNVGYVEPKRKDANYLSENNIVVNSEWED